MGERKVSFTLDGMFAVFHPPNGASSPTKKKGVLLVVPGMNTCIGPHRLYLNLAKELSRYGYWVMRFDPYGMGESFGQFEEEKKLHGKHYVDLFYLIENGRFVKDTRRMIDKFYEVTGINQVVIGGLCGGAITSIIAAAQDKRIIAGLLLGVPVELHRPVEKVSLDFNEKLNWRDPAALLLEGKRKTIDFLGKSKYLIKLFNAYRSIKDKSRKEPEKAAEITLSPIFLDSFNLCVRRRKKLLFILSENHESYKIFEKGFKEPYLDKKPIDEELYKIYAVKNADHIFGLKEWEDEMNQVVIDWMLSLG